MHTQVPFRISTHLKDVIGRDLVTNEYVAIFELVKNSFDAGASRVHIEFDPANDRMLIADDGKGMSADDIKSKWLFVAYSAKADGTEDSQTTTDYRDKIRAGKNFAGSKGIGRFSCDTLGTTLQLFSRADAEKEEVTNLKVNWQDFEQDSLKEFKTVEVTIDDNSHFPNLTTTPPPNSTGTILQIEKLRQTWDEDSVAKLRRYLAKLIDPFGTTNDVEVSTYLAGSDLNDLEINGPIGNDISDMLREKTARIQVTISDNKIVSKLVDRGRVIYEISEPNIYDSLENASIKGEIFSLNRSAKQTFTTRMKVRPIEFGSVFLFLNGFRIFPIGEEFDDTFGLNRRKQQGSSRYFGTRDIMGRIDINARPRLFREASSRDAGLIEDAHSRELYDAIRKQMIFRLERYVVGVNWKDKADQERETSEGLETDPAKRRILQIIGGLARSKDVEIISFDKNIVELADAREDASEKALKDLYSIAEREGDEALLKRIEQTRARISELEYSEEEARHDAQRLAEERLKSDARIEKLEKQSRYLASSQDLDAERIQLLLHQVNIYSGHIGSGAERALSTASNSLGYLSDIDKLDTDDIEDLAGVFRHDLRQLMDDLSYIRLENDRLQAVSRFAPNIKVDLDTSEIHGDILEFLSEYFDVMMSNTTQLPKVIFENAELSFKCVFSPFDLAVVIDNLVDNSRKAKAHKIRFKARRPKNTKKIELLVTDDGIGLDARRLDPTRIFEKHYTATAGGTGLGLYHVSQILGNMGGDIELSSQSGADRADFIITIPEKKN